MGRAIINAPPPPTTLYPQKQYDPSSHKVRRVACMIFKNARIIKGIEKHAQVPHRCVARKLNKIAYKVPMDTQW